MAPETSQQITGEQPVPADDPYGIYSEIEKFIKEEIEDNPSRLATLDGTLPNEVGC